MISLFSPERITERSFPSTPMIPKDRLHCPLRTLSLAGPLACVSFDLLQQAEETDIATILGPKSFVYRYAPYTYRDSSASCFESHHFFLLLLLLFLHSVVLGVDTPPYRGRVLHGKDNVFLFLLSAPRSSVCFLFLNSPTFFGFSGARSVRA